MFATLSFILGTLFTFCFTPYYITWLGFISLTGFLLILDKAKNNRKALLYGFMFGFGHHTTGLYWISNSLLVEPDKFAWLIPFAMSAIPAYLSIYIAIISWLTKKLEYKGIAKIFFFSGMWVMAEVIRGHAFTGFPWNLSGYIFLANNELSQFGSVIGFYGMSLLAILLFSSPYSIFDSLLRAYKGEIQYYKAGYCVFFLLPISTIFIGISYWGYERISENKGKEENVNIRLVQPNISQRDKYDPLRLGEHMYNYYSLTLEESKLDNFTPDLIIWPEAATPYQLSNESIMLNELKDIIPYSSYLMLGSVRIEQDKENKTRKFYNSIEFVNSDGKLEEQYYDKHHLVPFGEYVPLRKYLPGVESISHSSGDFSTGDGPQTLKLGKAPAFSPSICYEIIFPGKVTNKTGKESAKWILNLTNDGWFGISKGPHQHLDITRARAIEEGIPVVRVANTGISAVIDSLGQVLDRIELNKRGVIDSKLPSALHFQTIFSKLGIMISILLAGLFISSAGYLKFFGRSS